MKLSDLTHDLADDRCRGAFAEIAAREADRSEDWRYVVTPEFVSPDYIVSDQGRVLSLPRYRHYGASSHSRVVHRKFQPGGVMRPGVQPSGHQTICLSHDKEQFRTHVHLLVAWAFLGPQPAGHHIRHLDGDPSNNRLENLAYASSWDDNTGVFGPAHAAGTGLVIDEALARRVEAALDGAADARAVLGEIKDLLDRNRQKP